MLKFDFLAFRSLNVNALRVLVVVGLKSYIVILTPPKHKNNHTIVEL